MAIRRLLLPLAAVALVLGGCSGGDEDEDPVEGTGYTYSVPDGWRDVSEEAEEEIDIGGFRPDTLVIGEREDGFATNVNVVREDGLPAGVTAAQYANASLAGLRDPVGAGMPPEVAQSIEDGNLRQFSAPGDAELDGQQAFAWDYRGTQDGLDVRVHQMATVMDGAGYTVTLTASPAAFDDGSEALDQVVESWTWSSSGQV
jgi:hypothetical protein